MTDCQQVIANLEGLTFDDWRDHYSDSEVRLIAQDALDLLKEQQKEIENWIEAYSQY